MGMAHSIEVRMPFLDYRLVDFMGRVPPWIKMCGLHEKHVLKKALQPFLPDSITARVKHPYRAPVHKSLSYLLQSVVGNDLLSETAIRETGFFNQHRLDLFIKKLRSADSVSEMDAMALAGIISTQYICRNFIRRQQVPSPDVFKPDILIDKRSIH